MSYSAQTFTSSEQPTTAKWNLLWSNDASFNDGTGIANATISLAHLQTNVIPTGQVVMFGGSSAPTSWLMCDGTAISRATYATLFGILGTAYGAGDGSTTFNLPDLRQRFPLGKAASGTGSTLGSTGGNIDHNHATGGNVNTNGISTTTTSINNVNHTHSSVVRGGGTSDGQSSDHVHDFNHVHSLPDNSATKNPPYQVLNYIIKT